MPEIESAHLPGRIVRAARVPLELRRERRSGLRGVRERRGRPLTEFEFRANPDSAAGPSFRFQGYASVVEFPFKMYDPWGEPYTEILAAGSFTRTLNGAPDVPFLVGHQDDLGSKIPLARTKSSTLQLAQDSTGLHVVAPQLDGRRPDVQALASAIERGDMDEMSMAFISRQQVWSADYETRRITEVDINRGDVCVLHSGANPATAGASMVALPVSEAAARRRPGGERRTPTAPYSAKPGEDNECPQCHSMNDGSAAYCDQCGTAIKSTTVDDTADENDTQRCGCGTFNADDAKFCSNCGQNIASDGDNDNGGLGNGIDTIERAPLWSARDPRRVRRAGVPADGPQPDFSSKPAHDPSAHGDGSPQCPNPNCGAANAADAGYCDQCGMPLYDEGGLVASIGSMDDVVSDASGIVEEDDEMALAAARVRVLQLTGKRR